jgi:hypothetical protein
MENASLLPYVPAKRPNEFPSDTSYFSYATRRPTFETNPRIQQNKLGKYWKEDISLKNDDFRDLKDLDMNMMTTLLPLDSYEIYENEKDLIQQHNHYLDHDENEDKNIYFF